MPLLGSDSVTELWKAETQDAKDQGGKSGVLREETRMPQSAESAFRMGLEAAEPTALLPRAEAFPEPTGKKHPDSEKVGAPQTWDGNSGGLCLLVSQLSPKARPG